MTSTLPESVAGPENVTGPDRQIPAPTSPPPAAWRSSVGPGYRIPPDYDSLLAKVVVWAPDRVAAIARMDRALGEPELTGERPVTTAAFLRTVLAEPAFADGKHDTARLDRMARDRAGV